MLPRCAFLFHLVHTWLLSLAQECDFPETPTNTLSLFPLQGGTWGLPDSASRPPRVCWTVVPPLEWAHLLRGWFSCISSGRYPFLPHPKAEMSCLLKLVQRQEERATVKNYFRAKPVWFSLFFFFFFFCQNLVGFQFLCLWIQVSGRGILRMLGIPGSLENDVAPQK